MEEDRTQLCLTTPSSASESGSASGSESDSDGGLLLGSPKRKAKVHIKRSRSRSRSPTPDGHRKKHKKDAHKSKAKPVAAAAAAAAQEPRRPQKMSADARMVAPLPFMRFLESRHTPKACGRCEECKKPPCGTCRACIQNAKSAAKHDPPTKTSGKDRRRCEALKCTKDAGDSETALPQGIPDDRDALTEELAKASTDLADMSFRRGQADFDEAQYERLIEHLRSLREGLAIMKNRKARRRAKFQVGFHDVWGVLSSLEKGRIKFAKFIVRTASSDECRTIEMKRAMRDDLEAMQLQIARKHASLLAPCDEKEAFMAELAKGRQ